MSQIQIDIVWPDGSGSDGALLPLPYVDYGGANRNSTIISSLEGGPYARRSRFSKYYVAASVSWRLADAELADLRTFFESTLGNGSSAFGIELRYPKNSALSTWLVRFVGGYSAEFMEGLWAVSSRLELLEKVEELTPAVLVGVSSFQVIDETDSDGYVPFNTSEGYEFQVST
jgi:hypothetical protein